MKVVIEYGSGREDVEVSQGSTVMDVLRSRNISPDVSIAFVGSRPIPLDSLLEEGMVMRVVSVVSGG